MKKSIIRDGIFTSESVTAGHPDKVADAISDAILTEFLRQDKEAKVAVETMVSHGLVVVSGEVKAENAYVDVDKLVRDTIRNIGYEAIDGFSPETAGVLVNIKPQSEDINQAVIGYDAGDELGAGDQGMMFGIAVDETPTQMPMPIYIAHYFAKELDKYQKTFPDKFRPDGKTQASIKYVDGIPVGIEDLVISIMHSADVELSEVRSLLNNWIDIVFNNINNDLSNEGYPELKFISRMLINPSGRFVEGGPKADTGLTGRKIIVDTYGGYGRHGGGAFSGKDPSKVDRTGAYLTRYLAKAIVNAELSHCAEVQLSYAIGVTAPVSIKVNLYDLELLDLETKIENYFREEWEYLLTPAGSIKQFDLLNTDYTKLSAYGHMGKNTKWEQPDISIVSELKALKTLK